MVDLIIKIFLSVVLIVLGVFPNLFIVTNSVEKDWFNRLTIAGIVLVVLTVSAVISSIFIEIKNQRDSEKNQEILENLRNENVTNNSLLKDINQALKNSNLTYNPTEKSIVNNNSVTGNSTGNLLGVVSGGNGRISIEGLSMHNNVISHEVVIEKHEILGALAQYRIKFNITDKQVYLGAFKNTSGTKYLVKLEEILLSNGYSIVEKLLNVDPRPNYNTKGFKLDTYRGKMFIIAGDPE